MPVPTNNNGMARTAVSARASTAAKRALDEFSVPHKRVRTEHRDHHRANGQCSQRRYEGNETPTESVDKVHQLTTMILGARTDIRS